MMIAPSAAFIFVCMLGAFVGWIGGAQPFTLGAGVIAACSIAVAGFISAVVYDFRRK